MKYRFVVSTFLALLGSLTVFAQQKQDAAKLIAEGDKYATEAFDNQKALDTYMKALKIDGENDEVLWRISRCYVDIGEHLPAITKDEKAKQMDYYQKAMDYAEKAILVNPNNFMAYTRRAIAIGRVALFKGVWDSIDLVKRVKADCEKAIQMNPNDPTAYYILARTHAKLCEKPKVIRWPLGLSWANLDDAASNYEKAIALRSGFIMYRLDAARTYIEREEYQKAKEHLTKIASLATEDEDDGQFRKEAKDLYEEIRNK